MNLKKTYKSAKKHTPQIKKKVITGTYRHNVIDSLQGNDNIGIELGVAQGGFSKKMVDSGKFSNFYGVDMYADTHDTQEYKSALLTVGLLKKYKLFRMTFDNALDLFEDASFDFIYIDGFAHTGEEGGETLNKWYKKLKVGGIFAGDDYHLDWPLVVWAVNNFVKQTDSTLSITDKVEKTAFCEYPSWFITKENDNVGNFTIPKALQKSAESEKLRIEKKRKWRVKVRNIERALKKILKR